MFSLTFPAEPAWLDLPQGVRLQVRPLSSAIMAAADAYATRIIAGVFSDIAERIKLGVPYDDLPDLDNPDTRIGVYRSLMAVGLAQHGIVAWDGIGDQHGAPLQLTSATAEQFARLPIGLTFLRAYEATLEPVRAEGNASAAGPNGSSAPAANTAPDAQPGAPDALAT